MKTTPLDELISDTVMDVTPDLHSSYGLVNVSWDSVSLVSVRQTRGSLLLILAYKLENIEHGFGTNYSDPVYGVKML